MNRTSGIWEYRRVVPERYRLFVGKREWLASLGRDEAEARRRALVLDAESEGMLARLKSPELTRLLREEGGPAKVIELLKKWVFDSGVRQAHADHPDMRQRKLASLVKLPPDEAHAELAKIAEDEASVRLAVDLAPRLGP